MDVCESERIGERRKRKEREGRDGEKWREVKKQEKQGEKREGGGEREKEGKEKERVGGGGLVIPLKTLPLYYEMNVKLRENQSCVK